MDGMGGQRNWLRHSHPGSEHVNVFAHYILLYVVAVFLSGTASDDIAFAIDTYKKGHPYKCDKDGIIDIGVGKVAFANFLIAKYKHHSIENN